MGLLDSEATQRYILMNVNTRARSSARKRKVGTKLQAKCDGISARDRG